MPLSVLSLAPTKRITVGSRGKETLALTCRYGRKELQVWHVWLYGCSFTEQGAPVYSRDTFKIKDTKKQISEKQKSRDRIIDTTESPMYF